MKPNEQSTGDALIDEVRQARREISAQFDHDPVRLVAYYMERQKQHRDRLLYIPDEQPNEQSAA